MLAKVNSACVVGMDAYQVDVEVDLANGLPCFSVVGMPDTAIRESRDRIRSAIKNSGFLFPTGRITVNLSPADVKKEGVGFDLPIALGILAANRTIDQDEINDFIFCGELSLNGRLKPFRGALPIAIALKNKFRTFIFPSPNAGEISTIDEIDPYGGTSLSAIIDHIKKIKPLEKAQPVKCPPAKNKLHENLDFHDVKGQEYVKRGLEIAACGKHNVLMIGPPGSGKSMLAKRFPTILPNLTREESLETTNVYSIAGELKNNGLITERPVRSPHHTISYAAMVGGGSWASPGEISLANNGVLFLDELPEFRRDVLETLRQPIETGKIVISRVNRTLWYPCRFMLIAAMNPCPCGYFTDPAINCQCPPTRIQRYLSKISGPLLDRIDIHLDVPRLKYEELSQKRTGETSSAIKERVIKCHQTQNTRFADKSSLLAYNAYMSPKEIEKYCTFSKEAEELLKTAILELGISARAYDKILKISRTIADMEGAETINVEHISEAIGYRCLDRNFWG